MIFIPETALEEAADSLNQSDDGYERAVEELQQQQPVLLAYLFSENFEAFTPQEQEYLLYLTLVMYRAIVGAAGLRPIVTEEQLSEAEELNWGLLENATSHRFHERLDIFFQDYPQEDLLAFVEDALSDDSDELTTREGREALFIALKSIIDCLEKD